MVDEMLSKQLESITVFFFVTTFTPLLGAYEYQNKRKLNNQHGSVHKGPIRSNLTRLIPQDKVQNHTNAARGHYLCYRLTAKTRLSVLSFITSFIYREFFAIYTFGHVPSLFSSLDLQNSFHIIFVDCLFFFILLFSFKQKFNILHFQSQSKIKVL